MYGGEIVIETDVHSSIFSSDKSMSLRKHINKFSLAQIDLSKFNPLKADKESTLSIS